MTTNGSDSIRDLELKRFAAEKRLEQIAERMHNVERRCTIAVEDEWETLKDKALSNAQKRQTEVERRLAASEEYQTLKTERKELSDHNTLMRIDVDYLKRKHQTRLMQLMEHVCNGVLGTEV
jgi:hypothetical protein